MNPNNPFAVLRLPANATAAEIKSAGQLALAKLRLGDAGNVAAIRAVESAVEQLRDPVIRFKMGLEWPSLGPAAAKFLATDDAFGDLVSNWAKDRTQAIKNLIERESRVGQQHTCAVLHLSRARELFARALKPAVSSREGEPTKYLAAASVLFPKAMSLWVAATVSPEFWMAQRLRAKEINDPRVDAELCSTCQRESLRIAAQSFAALASESLLARDAPVCTSLIAGIRGCGADSHDTDRILAEIYEPHARKVTDAIQRVNTELEAVAGRNANAYRQILARYQSEIEPDMNLMLTIGDLPGTAEERARDAAGAFLKLLSVKAANDAKAYEVSRDGIVLAIKVAHSEALRKSLNEDLSTVTELLAGSRCTYCRERAADGNPNKLDFYKVTDRNFLGRVTYQTATVPVPRCNSCEARHRRWGRAQLSGPVVFIILGALIGASMKGFWGFLGGGACALIPGGILCLILNGLEWLSDRHHPSSYRPIADLVAQGWSAGSEPPRR